MQNIESLIPHRHPFIFADEIISANEDEIVAEKVFDERDHWLSGNFKDSPYSYIPGMILVESMAQCGGAGIKYLGLAEGLFGLASIDTSTFLKGVPFNVPVRYIIKNVRVSSKLIKQSGIGYVNGEAAVEASWLCVKID